VGQTKKTLNTRAVDHRNRIRRDTAQVCHHGPPFTVKPRVWLGWCEGVRQKNELQKASYFWNDPYKKTKTWIEFTKLHLFIGFDLQRSLTL